MNAKLRLIYTKEYVSPDKFLLRVQVEPVNSSPDTLDRCLVASKATGGGMPAPEYPERVATFDELITTPLPQQPLLVDRFSSFGYGALTNGDVITITNYPQIWTTFYSITGDVVRTVFDDTDPNNIIVDTPFPAWGWGLSFTINSNPNVYNDGIANRDYTGLSGSSFLTDDFSYEYTNFDDANNAIVSFEAQAQSLVDAMNIDQFSGVDTEDYV